MSSTAVPPKPALNKVHIPMMTIKPGLPMSYSVVTGDVFAAHDDPGHPESQVRLEVVLAGVPGDARRITPEQATA